MRSISGSTRFRRPKHRTALAAALALLATVAMLGSNSASALAGGRGVSFPSPRSSDACVPTSPEEMVSAAKNYIRVYGDLTLAPQAPLAPDIRRAEVPPPVIPRQQGGPVTGKSREELIAFWAGNPLLRFIRDFGDTRWIVDAAHCEVVLFWLIDFEAPTIPITVHIGERFRVSAGLIEEIEVVQWLAPGVDGSCWPADGNEGVAGLCARHLENTPYGPTPGCVPASSEAIGSTVQAYLDALASHDASGVPLGDQARRTEMPRPDGYAGPVTGTSGAAIAASLEGEARFASVLAVRNVRLFIDADRCQAVAYYLVDRPTSDPTVMRQSMRGTSHHVTRFLVSDGTIREVEDIRTEAIDSRAFEGSCFPQAWSDAQDHVYRALPCPA